MIPILSFFTGGGFLDIGFEQSGFEVIWVNENNPRYVEHYKKGYASWRAATRRKLCLPYIEERAVETLTTGMISYRCFSDGKPSVFGIIGGPPCPDFSKAGLHAGKDGDNGKLTKSFINLVCRLNPSFFLLENVTGLVRFKKHKRYFDQLIKQLNESGYCTDYTILNALDFGVPQHRERVFLVGFKKKLVNSHLSDDNKWFKWPYSSKYKDAQINFEWPSTDEFGDKPRRPKDIPSELYVKSCLIPKYHRNIIPNANCFFKPYSDKFLTVEEGDTSQKSFKRLHRYRFSPTACYGNNEVHLHPWEPRRLSVREAMRLQGIPDSYILPEGIALNNVFKMVSNGVPVPLAKYVARSLRRRLEIFLK